MRRKRKKKHLTLKILLVAIVLMTIVSFGYSYLSTILKIRGTVAGQVESQNYTILPGSDPNLKITITRTSTWQEGNLYKYQYSLYVTNIGQDTIDNFKVTLNFSHNIEAAQTWNYEYAISGKSLTITNSNYILTIGQTATISLILSSKSANEVLKSVKLEVNRAYHEVTLDQFNVRFDITNGWGHYTYQYNATVTNKTGSKVNAWQLVITLPTGTSYISGGWNAIFAFNGNTLTINNETYNGNLNNNDSASFGFQLSTNIINYIPNNIKVKVR